MGEVKQPPRSYSIHEAIARERTLSEASGSLSACPIEEDVYSDEDDSPLGLHCLPTLSRRVSRHVLPQSSVVGISAELSNSYLGR